MADESKPQVHGTCDASFDSLKQQLQSYLDHGDELGAAIYVDRAGQTLVDLWGGFANQDRTQPWQRDTIVNVWSCTKMVTALAALILVNRGLLDVDSPICRYWPEFAAKGKEAVTVRHLFAHMSGVSGWDAPFTHEDVYAVETAAAKLAAQAPWWEPGTACGYHAVNWGHLVGELVRRITGRSLGDFITEEIAGPLGADFQLGAREADWSRVAEIIPPPVDPNVAKMMAQLDPDSVAFKTFMTPRGDAGRANTAAFRRAGLGGVGGHGNARSLARILSVLARGGEVDGVRLLSPATVDRVFDVQHEGTDLVIGLPLRWGLGVGLPDPTSTPWIPHGNGRVCFWPGWGGSIVLVDAERQLTVAYVMNRMGAGVLGSDRTQRYIEEIYRVLTA